MPSGSGVLTGAGFGIPRIIIHHLSTAHYRSSCPDFSYAVAGIQSRRAVIIWLTS